MAFVLRLTVLTFLALVSICRDVEITGPVPQPTNPASPEGLEPLVGWWRTPDNRQQLIVKTRPPRYEYQVAGQSLYPLLLEPAGINGDLSLNADSLSFILNLEPPLVISRRYHFRSDTLRFEVGNQIVPFFPLISP